MRASFEKIRLLKITFTARVQSLMFIQAIYIYLVNCWTFCNQIYFHVLLFLEQWLQERRMSQRFLSLCMFLPDTAKLVNSPTLLKWDGLIYIALVWLVSVKTDTACCFQPEIYRSTQHDDVFTVDSNGTIHSAVWVGGGWGSGEEARFVTHTYRVMPNPVFWMRSCDLCSSYSLFPFPLHVSCLSTYSSSFALCWQKCVQHWRS